MRYRLLHFLAARMTGLSWQTLRRIADALAFLFWLFARGRRKETIAAIEKHLCLTHEEARRIARRSFAENFLSFLEIFHVARFHTADSVKVLYTPAILAALQAETAPIVIATAHLGAWEMMPGLATDLLPEREGLVVVRKQRATTINKIMAELRGARGMKAVDHRQATQVVLPSLRKGGVTAFLVDHNANRQESIFLPFLEDIAAVNVGPASLALRTKAAVYPVFLLRDGKGGHILHLLPPLHTANLEGALQERIRRIAVFYTDAVASMVRAYPEQWFWMHRRWKTREGAITRKRHDKKATDTRQ